MSIFHKVPKKHILAVRCNDPVYFRFGCATQNVSVEKVFAGSDMDVGSVFNILVSSSLSEDGDITVNGKGYYGTNFVNTMEPGKVYLVFLDRKIDNHDSSDPIYRFSEEFLIKPLFSYEETGSEPLSSESEGSASVSYQTAKDSEFFLASQASIDKILALREELISEYSFDLESATTSD